MNIDDIRISKKTKKNEIYCVRLPFFSKISYFFILKIELFQLSKNYKTYKQIENAYKKMCLWKIDYQMEALPSWSKWICWSKWTDFRRLDSLHHSSYKHTIMDSRTALHVLFSAQKCFSKFQIYTIFWLTFGSEQWILPILWFFRDSDIWFPTMIL